MTETSNTTTPAATDRVAACRKHAAEALDHFTEGTEFADLRLRIVGLDHTYRCSCGRQAVYYLRRSVSR